MVCLIKLEALFANHLKLLPLRQASGIHHWGAFSNEHRCLHVLWSHFVLSLLSGAYLNCCVFGVFWSRKLSWNTNVSAKLAIWSKTDLVIAKAIVTSESDRAQDRSRSTKTSDITKIDRDSGFWSAGCLAPFSAPRPSSGRIKAHKHKQFCPVTARVRGRLPTGWPGVKCLCAVCGIQGKQIFSAPRPSRVKFAWNFPFSRVKFAWNFPFFTPFLAWNFGEIFSRTPKPWKT